MTIWGSNMSNLISFYAECDYKLFGNNIKQDTHWPRNNNNINIIIRVDIDFDDNS